MTDAELDAIRARVAAASAGPWRLPYGDGAISRPFDERDRQEALDHDPDTEPEDIDDVSLCGVDSDGMGLIWRREDAEFIAHARDDVPALLAEIDRLRRS